MWWRWRTARGEEADDDVRDQIDREREGERGRGRGGAEEMLRARHGGR